MKKKGYVSFNRSSCKRVRVGEWMTLDSSPSSFSDNKALVVCKVADNKLFKTSWLETRHRKTETA